VKADAYHKEWQQEKLAEVLNAPVKNISEEDIAHIVDVSSADSEDAGTGLCETDTSISTCLRSDSSTCSNPDENLEEDRFEIYGSAKMQRLFISHELQPRPLLSIDSRVKDVQRITRGRLVWLSHICDEAHYRFLKPIQLSSTKAMDTLSVERREEWKAESDRIEMSDAFLASSIDKMLDWVNRNKHGLKPK
jgi:hypothetical protein